MALALGGGLNELLSPYFEAERAPLEKVCVLFERVEQDEGIFCERERGPAVSLFLVLRRTIDVPIREYSPAGSYTLSNSG